MDGDNRVQIRAAAAANQQLLVVKRLEMLDDPGPSRW
jgi:hypothetical protein